MKLRTMAPQRLLLQALDQLLAQPAARVLDVGAGSVVEKNRRAGQLVLAERYEQLTRLPGYLGLDIELGANVRLVADAHALPLADGTLDGVLMVSVLEHLYDPVRAVEQVGRVLRPGGLFFSYAPFYHPYHPSPNDYYRFTVEGYRYLLRDFSKVELVSGGNYAAVLNDVVSHAFGGSRVGRALARVLVELPIRLVFDANDSSPAGVAVGYAALAVK